MPKQIDRAKRDAINATLKTARTRITSKVGGNASAVTTLKAGDVRERIFVSRKASLVNAFGILTISNRKISLWKYGGSMADYRGFESQKGVKPVSARKPSGGASFKVYRGGGRAKDKKLFIRAGKKTRQIFIMRRDDDARRNDKAPRDYKIAYGPSIWEVIQKTNILPGALKEMEQVLQKNIESQINRFLNT